MAARTSVRKRWAVDRQQLLILLVAAVMMTSFVLLVCWPKERELTAVDRALEHEGDLVSRKVLASNEGVYISARIPSLRMAQGVFCRHLPPEPALSGPAPAVALRLRLTGPFEDVYRCLAAVEGLERLNRFRRVRCVRSGSPGWVVAEAEILVFYLPAPDQQTAPGKTSNDGRATLKRARA